MGRTTRGLSVSSFDERPIDCSTLDSPHIQFPNENTGCTRHSTAQHKASNAYPSSGSSGVRAADRLQNSTWRVRAGVCLCLTASETWSVYVYVFTPAAAQCCFAAPVPRSLDLGPRFRDQQIGLGTSGSAGRAGQGKASEPRCTGIICCWEPWPAVVRCFAAIARISQDRKHMLITSARRETGGGGTAQHGSVDV